MADDAGPIEVVDVAAVLAGVIPPPPGGLVWEEEAEYTRILGELGGDIEELIRAAEEDEGAEPVPPGDQVEAALAYDDDGGAADYELDGARTAADEADGQVEAASAAVPGEAWQDPPPMEWAAAPWWPPPAYIAIPGMPAPLVPAPAPAPAPAPGPAPGLVTVAIVNQTRPGATDFYVGDSWEVTVHGPANQEVRIHAWQDGQDRGEASLGYTHSGGEFRLYGSMSEEHRGSWFEVWTVGGTAAVAPLSFEVS